MKKETERLRVGQAVYMREGDFFRAKNPRLQEGVIVTVGRKYYTVESYGRKRQFNKDTLLEETKYGCGVRLFTSTQDISDLDETGELVRRLQKEFDYNCKLPLDKLRRIMAVIEEGEEDA